MQNQLCAVIILYNGVSSRIHYNINSYIEYVDKLYIIDNSSNPSHFTFNENKIEYIKQDKNIGIAKALNIALNLSQKEGYRYLLTMDQDTSFPKQKYDFFSIYKNFMDHNCIILSPLHNKKFLNLDKNTKYKLTVMTSGNILDIKKAKNLGGFDESLFIDEVDHEFCLRAKLKYNYNIKQIQKCYLSHNLGEKNDNKNTIYPLSRIYYQARNYLYIKKKYKNLSPIYFKYRSWYLIKFFIKQFYYSKNKLTFLYTISIALKDHLGKIYGKKDI